MALKEWSEDKVEETMNYLRFLSDRATGHVPTGAKFLRGFVNEHPGYNRDSQLNQQINYDLL